MHFKFYSETYFYYVCYWFIILNPQKMDCKINFSFDLLLFTQFYMTSSVLTQCSKYQLFFDLGFLGFLGFCRRLRSASSFFSFSFFS